MFAGNNSKVKIINSHIYDNTGSAGGGVYSYGSNKINIMGTQISGNTGTSGGGGLCFEAQTDALLTKTLINNNVSGIDGGGILSISLVKNHSK